MPQRNELVTRANAVGITPSNYPNDSKLEQKVLYMEKFGTTYTETLGTGVFTTAGADVVANDTATIGNTVYTFVTTLSGVKATGLLTTTGVFSDGDTVTIEGKTYTFRTTLSNPVQINEVLIGAAATNSLDNLKLAINQGGTNYPTAVDNSGVGSTWSTGTVRHSLVNATTKTATTLLVQANDYGTQGNQYSLVETGANCSWGAALMGTVVTSEVAGVANVLNQIKIQASAAVTLDVFKDAINGTTVTGTIGTDYSTGTVAHTQVTATTNTNTAQTVASRNAAFDNASILISTAGGGNMAAGAANLASGVRGVIAANTTTMMGNAGVSGDKNLV